MSIYLDNAATTPIAPEVLKVMSEVMANEFGNPSSIHANGRKARAIVEDARKRIANHINASQGEVFFTSCATESNNTAILGSVRDLGVTRIVTSPTEHPCVLNTVKHVKEEYNIEVTYLQVDQYGNPDIAQLEKEVSNQENILVSLMHGNNEIGTMIDMEAVGEICKKHGALFHCDTVQTVGKYPIDVSKSFVSFLSGSGHKIYGPKGIGFMYINNDNLIKAMIKGGGQERELRSGTENTYGIAGLAEALDFTVENREAHHQYIGRLRNKFKSILEDSPIDVQFNGNQNEKYLDHIVSVSVPRDDRSEMAMMSLDIYGISASAGSACSSGVAHESHVLEAIGANLDRKTIRFSFSYRNTEDEVEKAAQQLIEILS